MNELDCVKVVKLLKADRPFDGTENIKRPPKIGDTGTIVHLEKNFYIVESIDADGYKVWLADFLAEELEIYE